MSKKSDRSRRPKKTKPLPVQESLPEMSEPEVAVVPAEVIADSEPVPQDIGAASLMIEAVEEALREPEPVKRVPKTTFPERVAQIMQRDTMTVKEVVAILQLDDEPPRAANLSNYVNNTLCVAKQTVTDSRGNPIKVHRFVNVSHGRYRVATPQDIQREIGMRNGKQRPSTESARRDIERGQSLVRAGLEEWVRGIVREELSREHLRAVVRDELRNAFSNSGDATEKRKPRSSQPERWPA